MRDSWAPAQAGPKVRHSAALLLYSSLNSLFTPRDRHVAFAPDGSTAWFDEIVESPRWGRFRGTGVVRLLDGKWRVAHYSLTLLVPNESFEGAAGVALEGFRARHAAAETALKKGAQN